MVVAFLMQKRGGDMNERQRRFAEFYIETLNAYDSAIRAGYSERYAKAQSYKMLEIVGIKEYIEKRFDELEEERIAKSNEVLKYLTSLMRGEEKEQTLIGLGQGEQNITEIEVSARERLKAAELLGKRYALFTDKMELEGNIGAVIVDDVPNE